MVIELGGNGFGCEFDDWHNEQLAFPLQWTRREEMRPVRNEEDLQKD